jgi:hypothetical protein
LSDKGIQGAPRPAVPRPAERHQNAFNYVRPKRRGQVFFQKKAAGTHDVCHGAAEGTEEKVPVR